MPRPSEQPPTVWPPHSACILNSWTRLTSVLIFAVTLTENVFFMHSNCRQFGFCWSFSLMRSFWMTSLLELLAPSVDRLTDKTFLTSTLPSLVLSVMRRSFRKPQLADVSICCYHAFSLWPSFFSSVWIPATYFLILPFFHYFFAAFIPWSSWSGAGGASASHVFLSVEVEVKSAAEQHRRSSWDLCLALLVSLWLQCPCVTLQRAKDAGNAFGHSATSDVSCLFTSCMFSLWFWELLKQTTGRSLNFGVNCPFKWHQLTADVT